MNQTELHISVRTAFAVGFGWVWGVTVAGFSIGLLLGAVYLVYLAVLSLGASKLLR